MTFSSLNFGDCFEWNGDVWVKTGSNSCVHNADWVEKTIDPNTYVTRITCE